MVIKLDEKKNFTGLTTLPALVKKLLSKMLTCDLFAIANFLSFVQNQR